MEEHPETRVGVLTSAVLDFPSGQSVFTCSTRVAPYQRVQIVGTAGRIEVEVPVNAPPDEPTRIFVDDGADLHGGGLEVIEFGPCDQYTVQGDLFSQVIREGGEVATTLEDSIRNMAVVEAVSRSAKSGRWEAPVAADLAA